MLVDVLKKMPKGTGGFAAYTLCLLAAFFMLPPITLQAGSAHFVFAIGFLALWRYSWGATHFVRSLIYRKFVFPRLRRDMEGNIDHLMPSKIYLLITSFRIETETNVKVIKAAIQEAIDCGVEVSIVASVVELADEFLYKELFQSFDPPEHIRLHIVRIPGTGKRDALAQGFRAISRDMPPRDAVVAVIDGDSVLTRGTLKSCGPFFKLRPDIGALTTDEIAEVEGSQTMKKWIDMRFAQRHILMSSLALSGRVMTLTGRMSMYRADIITNRDFIDTVENDYLDHGRLGTFRFLTGDDKSTLYWVLKEGYAQLYVPDVQVVAMEKPPAENFLKASTMLMLRWFGNMLRTNMRILRLGPSRMPFFTWWSFLDQRISMWTSLTGPVLGVMLATQYGGIILIYYFVWVAFVRWVMALALLSARPVLSWRYPFLLYYSQIYGALVKTYVLFRLDRQSWTRQKTELQRRLPLWEQQWNHLSSAAVHVSAMVFFVGALGLMTGLFSFPVF